MKIIWLFLILFPPVIVAQTCKVGGNPYIYYASSDMSPKLAREAAIENARIQSIAKEFGTLVTQTTHMQEYLVNGHENNVFMQLSSLEVKGEWQEDTKEPKVEFVEILNNGVMVIKATVWGKARALNREATPFEATILRNGTTKRYAATQFKNGDDLYVLFRAPVKGYVAIYLADESQNVYRILPYKSNQSGFYQVEADKEYVFFSPDHASEAERSYVDELQLTNNGSLMEMNQIYIVFSPNPFFKPNDRSEDRVLENGLTLPNILDFSDFNHWLAKQRSRDLKMGLSVMKLIIEK